MPVRFADNKPIETSSPAVKSLYYLLDCIFCSFFETCKKKLESDSKLD